MGKKQYSLNHALHNEEVCKYLDKRTDFTDWVITTAFYSSLHFVYYKIFQITTKSKIYNDFDKYYNNNNPQDLSPHKFTSKLIEEKHPYIAAYYNKLKDICWTARYHNYNYSKEYSDEAKELLRRIKNYCIKKK